VKKVKSLLLIDDDTDDKELFLEAVAEIDNSVNCMSAKDGVEAIQLLQQVKEQPNLIFLDLNMPRMDGREFLTRIKNEDRLKNIPVIVYSTSKLEKDRDETKELGAADFMSKPSVFDELCRQIEAMLSRDWNGRS
jgi:CheY-like chemotaxis protein